MNVTKLIRSYGYTLRQVEHELGYKEGSIRTLLSRANTKEGCNISIALLTKIADCIGCHIAEFFLDEPTTHKGIEIEHKIPVPKDKLKKEKEGQPTIMIKAVLKEKNVSIQELADKLGFTYMGTWSLINKQSISTDNLYKIADILGIKVTDLFRYE